MFTHLMMESGFGASFELGRTPKLAGPQNQQDPSPGSSPSQEPGAGPFLQLDQQEWLMAIEPLPIADSHLLAPRKMDVKATGTHWCEEGQSSW